MNVATIRNLIINGCGHLFNALSIFVITPFIIDYLGKDGYGLWSLMVVVIGYVALLDLGIRASVCRYIIRYSARSDYHGSRAVLRTGLAIYLVIGVAIVFFVQVVAEYFFEIFPVLQSGMVGSDVNIVLTLLSLGSLCALLTAVYNGLLQSKEAFWKIQLISAGGVVLRFGLNLLSIERDLLYIGLSLSICLTNFVNFVVTVLTAYKTARESFSLIPRYYKRYFVEIIVYASSCLVITVAIRIGNETDIVLIGMYLTAEDITMYSLGAMLTLYGWNLIAQIGTTLIPKLHKYGATMEVEKFQDVMNTYTLLYLIFGGLLYSGIILFGRDFFDLWLGEGHDQAYACAAILAASRIALLFASAIGPAMSATNHMGLTTSITLLDSLVNFLLTWACLAVFEMGVLAVAMATLISRVVVFVGLHFYTAFCWLKEPFLVFSKKNLFVVVPMASFCLIFAYGVEAVSIEGWLMFFGVTTVFATAVLGSALALSKHMSLWKSV
ncbi:MAG: lipopolysaccharide biosynthesis protein [Candidatus Competibacterales bacterium]